MNLNKANFSWYYAAIIARTFVGFVACQIGPYSLHIVFNS